jgi:hypothetical protein
MLRTPTTRARLARVATLASLLSSAACGGEPSATESAAGAAFDDLVHAIVQCASMFTRCDDDEDAGGTQTGECRATFLGCRSQAGSDAQTKLVNAAASCVDRADQCRSRPSDASVENECADRLRACIGDARSQPSQLSHADAAAPDVHAPTYQCFGQLRECILAEQQPTSCAAHARECVVSALGTPPARPVDAGQVDAGRGMQIQQPKFDASMPDAADGGTAARAAQVDAGRAPEPMRDAAAQAPERDAALDARTAPDCAAQYAACLDAGDKPAACERDQRKCDKQPP